MKTMCIVYRYHVGTCSTEDVIVLEVQDNYAADLMEKDTMAYMILDKIIGGVVALNYGKIVTTNEIVQIKEWEGGL